VRINYLYRNTYHIIIVILFYSCAGTQPEWVNQLDNNPIYIQGVGVASKTEKDYRELAFKSAEREIARQLEIDIKSISRREKVVNLSKTVKDIYTEFVQTNIQQNLKDVKKIDEFQDKVNFYVLLGLDREKYLKRKKEEKDQAFEEIQNIMKSLGTMSIDEQLSSLNKAMGLILEKDMLYKKNLNDDYLYSQIKSQINQWLSKLSIELENSTITYNPLLQNKLSVPISVRYNGALTKALPISIIVNDTLVSNSLSNDRSTTKIIVEPKNNKDQVVRIMLSKTIFGEDNDFYVDADLDLGGFLIRPVIGDLEIKIIGPLVKKQKQRIKSRIEQFLLTRFHYEKSADEKTNIQVSLERSDKARISDNYPFVSYSSGAVIITNNSVKNVFKIESQKGVNFESADKAFDVAINKICAEQNISVIFETNKGKAKK
jgi:hypothetical protein